MGCLPSINWCRISSTHRIFNLFQTRCSSSSRMNPAPACHHGQANPAPECYNPPGRWDLSGSEIFWVKKIGNPEFFGERKRTPMKSRFFFVDFGHNIRWFPVWAPNPKKSSTDMKVHGNQWSCFVILWARKKHPILENPHTSQADSKEFKLRIVVDFTEVRIQPFFALSLGCFYWVVDVLLPN